MLLFVIETSGDIDAFCFSDWATNREWREWKTRDKKIPSRVSSFRELISLDKSCLCIVRNWLHAGRLLKQCLFSSVVTKTYSHASFLSSSVIATARNSCSVSTENVNNLAANTDDLSEYDATGISKATSAPHLSAASRGQTQQREGLWHEYLKFEHFFGAKYWKVWKSWEATPTCQVSIMKGNFMFFFSFVGNCRHIFPSVT